MTATQSAPTSLLADPGPTVAVVTSDGASWTWDDLYKKYSPMIHSYARSKGIRQADDIIQEVFTAMVQQLANFEGDESGLRSLLFTVAFRRVADHHRRSYRNQETLVAEYHPTADPGPTIEDSITTRQSADTALKAFDILTTRERQVLQLRLLRDASPAEVAETLGLSNTNVRVIQARALAKVRNHLMAQKGGRELLGVGLVFATARGFFADWINDSEVRQWAEQMRRDHGAEVGMEQSLHEAHFLTSTMVGSTHTMQSLAQSLAQQGAAGIMAIVSVVALSTAPATIGADRITTVAPPMEASQTVDSIHHDVASDVPGLSTPVEGGGSQGGEPETSGTTETQDGAAGQGHNSSNSSLLDPVTETVTGIVIPVVDQTLDLVTGTLDGLVTELVDPLLNTLVDPLVEGLVDPLADDALDPLIDDIVDAVADVPNLLKGLLSP